MQATLNPVTVYTEMTPNPETMKFVCDKLLLASGNADFPDIDSAKLSPLASELFGFPFVKSVFVMNNFITLTRQPDVDWYEVMPQLRDFIRQYLEAGKEIFSKDFVPVKSAVESNSNTENRIKEVLDKYVKPAVEMDGGAIHFRSFIDGKLRLTMQGSCSGCPSSVVTLKAGIENLMKQMVPEVQEVLADDN